MIKIVAKMVVKESYVEAFPREAANLVRASSAEAGNVFYTLNQSAEDPKVFCFIECWKDQAAIDAHNASAHFTLIFPQLAAMTEEEPEVGIYHDIEF